MPGLAGHFFWSMGFGGAEPIAKHREAGAGSVFAAIKTSSELESFRLKVLGGSFLPNADRVRLTIGRHRGMNELSLTRFIPVRDQIL